MTGHIIRPTIKAVNRAGHSLTDRGGLYIFPGQTRLRCAFYHHLKGHTMFEYYRLLRDNRDFARLWGAQVISLAGDWFTVVVLSALIVRFTEGTGYQGLAVSGFLLSQFIPPLIFSPLAGVLVDRYDRRWLLIGSNVLRALVVPLYLLADTPDMLWLIYLVTVIKFTLSTVFEPGQSAVIPGLVQRSDLVRASTLVSVTWSVMLSVGAVLGGIVGAAFGTETALILDALTFLLAAYLLYRMHYERPARAVRHDAAGNVEPEQDTSFREGLRYVRRTPEVAAAIFVKFGISVGNIDTLVTIFATQIFIMGENGVLSLGIMYGVFGVGALIGPLITNRFNDGSNRRMRHLITVGFVALVAGWFILGTTYTLVLACVAIFVRAVGGSINWTYSTIIVQNTADDDYMGRAFSVDMAGFQLMTVISALVHGGLIDMAGTDNVRLISSWTGVVSLIPLLIWVWLVAYLDRRQSRPSGA